MTYFSTQEGVRDNLSTWLLPSVCELSTTKKVHWRYIHGMPQDPDFGLTVTGSTPRPDSNTDFINVKGSVFVPRYFDVHAELTHKGGGAWDVG
jgi:hypothetical protein